MVDYNKFHEGGIIQTRVINENNFTYFTAIQIIRRIINGKQRLKVLDYGCGVGTLALFVANKGNYVTGVDISSKAINLCKKSSYATSLSGTAKFLTLKEWKKSNSAKKYDLIICIEVIEHVENDKKALANLVKSLKNGGYILISTPSVNAPLHKLGLLKEFDKTVGHLRRYSTNYLVELLNSNGVEVVDLEVKEGLLRNILFTNKILGKVIRILKGPLSEVVMHIDNLFVRVFGGSNYYITGKKP